MFSPKQLLVQCITLLCLENRKGMSTSPSQELVGQVISSLPLPESTVDVDHSRQTFIELRGICHWLAKLDQESFPPEAEIRQQIQVACREESYLFEALKGTLAESYNDVDNNARVIQSYRATLNRYLTDEKLKAVMKDTYHTLMFKEGTIESVPDLIAQMGERLAPLIEARSKQRHPAMRGSVGFDDDEETAKVMNDAKISMSGEGSMRTGWKALNRSMGKTGALKRGEFVLIGGLMHQFKSGFMMSLFCHLALFNKPVLRDPTKKPLLYFITFENEIQENLMWIYKYLKENRTGEPVVEGLVDPKEAAQYVREALRAQGWHVMMDRIDPTEFSATSLTQHLDGLMSEGYEICGLLMDYLNMVSKTGIQANVAGDDIRLLFRRIRNYTSS